MERSQVRAARALLGWSQEDLAKAAGVSGPTIKRIEPGNGPLRTGEEIISKIRRAIEVAGVDILDVSGQAEAGVGVRLRFANQLSRHISIRENLRSAVLNLDDAGLISQNSKTRKNLEQIRALIAAEIAEIDLAIRYEEEMNELLAVSQTVSEK